MKLRKYSFQTGKTYISVVKEFLKSGKSAREFLPARSGKSRSYVRNAYFALKFFYENVLGRRFEERILLAKNGFKLPVVLNREEVKRMTELTENLKHRLVIMFLYYAGMRLNEVRNVRWEDIDLGRELIHIKIRKAGRTGSFSSTQN